MESSSVLPSSSLSSSAVISSPSQPWAGTLTSVECIARQGKYVLQAVIAALDVSQFDRAKAFLIKLCASIMECSAVFDDVSIVQPVKAFQVILQPPELSLNAGNATDIESALAFVHDKGRYEGTVLQALHDFPEHGSIMIASLQNVADRYQKLATYQSQLQTHLGHRATGPWSALLERSLQFHQMLEAVS